MMRIVTCIKRGVLIVAVGALGLVAGALALYLVLTGDGRTLQIWHTEVLKSEFTAAQQDEVRTYDDYRKLEQRLFAELDDSVYARTETGSAFALVRYSRGSAADPARRAINWNRSFELPADSPAGGVLLLHGMSDSPYSLRAIGEALNRRGYWVLGLRMPGHGTAPSGMTTVTWEDMAAAVRLGVNDLAAKVGTAVVHVIGYSTGAPLALDYTLGALDRPGLPVPASLVLVSPAIGVTPAAALAKWKHRLSRLPGFETLAWTQILPEFDPFKYNSFTSNAADQVHRMTRSVARRIDERAAAGANGGFPPVLVFLSAADATVSTDAVVDTLLNPLAGARNELVLFDVNRRSVSSTVMIADPGPLTARLMASPALPFALTLLANESPDSAAVVVRRKESLSARASSQPLGVSWPAGLISLSHIALPFPPDDPLYGSVRRPDDGLVFLGQIAVQGERGLLLFPADWLVRLRHNPFYDYLETRTLAWIEGTGRRGHASRD